MASPHVATVQFEIRILCSNEIVGLIRLAREYHIGTAMDKVPLMTNSDYYFYRHNYHFCDFEALINVAEFLSLLPTYY